VALTLYMYPASITSRPVRLFIAEKRLPVAERVVDIVTGEHYKDEFTSLNPSRMVPVLEDGEFRLTEASAILKYLATRFDAPEYPVGLEARAKVDEVMDWFNTQFYRDFLYDFVYPQVLPHHKRPTEAHHLGTIAWGREKARGWFEVLDRSFLDGKDFVANDRCSIADYLGGALVAAGEMIGCTYETYPNVRRWLGNLRELEHWGPTNEAVCRFVTQLAGTPFVTL
jgi:glutathione S-transferase